MIRLYSHCHAKQSDPYFRLDLIHSYPESLVVGRPVKACVNAAMAIRTERNHKARMVRPSVTYAANVVRLEVGRSVEPRKRSPGFAAFAAAYRPGKHVVPDVGASLVDVPNAGYLVRRKDAGGGERAPLKLVERRVRRALGGCCFHPFNDRRQRPKFKNNRIPLIAVPVGSAPNVVPFVDHFVYELQSSVRAPKEKEAFAAGGVICDGLVARIHSHVADLTFAKVLEDAIGPPFIGISVLASFLPCDDEDQRKPPGHENATLLLSPEARVNVLASIIDAPLLKAPAHHRLPACLPNSGTMTRAGSIDKLLHEPGVP